MRTLAVAASVALIRAVGLAAVITVSACSSSDQSSESSSNVNIANDISPSGNNSDAPATAAQPERIKIKIRTIAGEPKQTAYLVDRLQNTTPEKIENAVRESGYPCTSAKGFYQLEQNGELVDIYKIDCAERSYQLTSMNGQTFFKPWTGNMFGSTE